MGGIIGIIALIIELLKAMPDIIRLVMAIIDMIRGLPRVDRRALLSEFRDALKLARDTKDTSALEAFHKKLSALCTGSDCRL